MSPLENRALLLATELESDWNAVGTHLQRAQSVEPQAGPAEAALVALSLDHAYQTFESLLLRVDRSVSLPDPGGAAWHGQLLERASLAIQGVRGALYPPEAKLDWVALLRFRHFLRHAYAVELDAEQLARNRERLASATKRTEPYIARLCEGLRQTAPRG